MDYYAYLLSSLDVTRGPEADLVLLKPVAEGLVLAHLEIWIAAMVDEAGVVAA